MASMRIRVPALAAWLILSLAAAAPRLPGGAHLRRARMEVTGSGEVLAVAGSEDETHRTASAARFAQRLSPRLQGAVYVGVGFSVGGQAMPGAIFDTGSWEVVVVGKQCHEEQLCTECRLPADAIEGCAGKRCSDAEVLEKCRQLGECVRSVPLCGAQGYDAAASVPLAAGGECASVAGADPGVGRRSELRYGSGPVELVRGVDLVEVGTAGAACAPVEVIERHGMPMLASSSLQAIVGLAPAYKLAQSRRLLMGLGASRFAQCLPMREEEDGWLLWDGEDPRAEAAAGGGPGSPRRVELLGDLRERWFVGLDRLRFGEDEVASSMLPALLDTGTSLLAMPAYLAASLRHRLERVAADCCADPAHTDCPNLTFELGGVPHTLPPEAYLAVVDDDDTGALELQATGRRCKGLAECMLNGTGASCAQRCLAEFTGQLRPLDRHPRCAPLFMEQDVETSHGKALILGLPFFRHYFTTFDSGEADGRAPWEAPVVFTQALGGAPCAPPDGRQTGPPPPRRPLSFGAAGLRWGLGARSFSPGVLQL